jgi:hypothetical protein
MDIRVLHLSHLDEESIFIVDVHCRGKLDAVVDDHVRDRVEHSTGDVCGQPGHQQFWKTAIV